MSELQLCLPVLRTENSLEPTIDESVIIGQIKSFLSTASSQQPESLSSTHLERQSSSLLSNIRQTFPDIHDAATLAAMAVWLHVLVTVDDMVESMDHRCAQAALSDMIALLASLQHGAREPGIKLEHPRPKSFTHPKASDCGCPGPIHVSRRERKLLISFWFHIRFLLKEHCHETLNCLHAVTNVLRAMSDEARFKQSDSRDPEVYLVLREQTIGTAPFFSLIRGKTMLAEDAAVEYAALERCASLAVGLQNDLIGLKRDVVQQNPMNYVLILRAQSCASDVQSDDNLSWATQYIRETIRLHNSVVDEAWAHWIKIQLSCNSGVMSASLKLLNFITNHFKLAKESSRWKSI